MTKRDLFSLSLKILGVVYIIMAAFGLISLFMVIEMLQYPSSGVWNVTLSALMSVLYIIILLFIAFILFKWGDQFADKLVTDDTSLPGLGTSDWEKPLFTLGVRIAGLFCLIFSVNGIIYHALYWYFNNWNWGLSLQFYDENWARIIRDFVVFVLGLYMLRGGKHVVRYVFREPKVKPIENGPE